MDMYVIKDITITDDRQRKTFKPEDMSVLKDSIKRNGLINPITITDNGELIAGERRLRACIELGWTEVPVRFFNSLSENERKIIELEENVHRADLPWQEEAHAIRQIYELMGVSQERLAIKIGYSIMTVSRAIAVSKGLETQPENLAAATSIKSAFGMLKRRQERVLATQRDEIEETTVNMIMKDLGQATPESAIGQMNLGFEDKPSEASTKNIDDIYHQEKADLLNADFCEWIKTYNGKKFNFLHCDFPYGVNLDKSGQANQQTFGDYADDPDVYWNLCSTLAANIDKILYPSAHCIFWFGMQFYSETLEFFRKHTDFWVCPLPIIWQKSDGKGIVSDFTRRPRHTYETAFLMSRGDRKILKPCNDAYAAPTSKLIHTSEKPEPMLRYFFQMCVDNLTEMLDPTAGSGSSLRAAESLGAARVQGLEINPEFARLAQIELHHARIKQKLNKE